MIIEKYNIILTRLKEADIELIRDKRNSTMISNLMHERINISSEMQKIWFDSINNIYNNYFVIEYNHQKIGLVNGKNSDYEKRQSEGGMFIWEPSYWGTTIPALCSIIMSDFTFLINGFERNYIKILKSNSNSINYNKQLGYVVSNDYPSDNEVQWYVLTKDDYLNRIKKIRIGVKNITGDGEPLSNENISFKDDSCADLDMLYKPLPRDVKQIVESILEREKMSFKLI